MSRVSPATLKKNLALINARPKKVLHYQTPQDLFCENLTKCCNRFDCSSAFGPEKSPFYGMSTGSGRQTGEKRIFRESGTARCRPAFLQKASRESLKKGRKERKGGKEERRKRPGNEKAEDFVGRAETGRWPQGRIRGKTEENRGKRTEWSFRNTKWRKICRSTG